MIILEENLPQLEKPVTFVMGTFDILHAGHIHFLEQAKKAGGDNKLFVVIIPDKTVAILKGSDRPVIHEEERALIVDALRIVDYVYIAPELPLSEVSKKIIAEVQPRVSVASRDDWDNRKEEWQVEGTELVLLDKIQDRSTTKIVQKIRR